MTWTRNSCERKQTERLKNRGHIEIEATEKNTRGKVFIRAIHHMANISRR